MSESSTIVVETAAKEGQDEAGSITGEIGDTKADDAGNKLEAAGKGVITEAAWINFVFVTKPPAGIIEELKAAEPTGAVTFYKERVPDSFIDILKNRRLFMKLPSAARGGFSNVHAKYPELREKYESVMTRRNYCVDLHADILRQLNEGKGFAEVGVDFTNGVKKIFILPQH